MPLLASLPGLPHPLPDSLDSLPAGWQQLPDSFAILGAYNTQYLALGARANPGGRMGDGAWDVWHMAADGGAHRGKRASGGVRARALKVLLGIEDGGFAKSPGVMRTTKVGVHVRLLAEGACVCKSVCVHERRSCAHTRCAHVHCQVCGRTFTIPSQARALMFEQRDSATWTVLDGEEVSRGPHMTRAVERKPATPHQPVNAPRMPRNRGQNQRPLLPIAHIVTAASALLLSVARLLPHCRCPTCPCTLRCTRAFAACWWRRCLRSWIDGAGVDLDAGGGCSRAADGAA